MPKILIIDDDPQLRDIYIQEFTRVGYTIESAIDGEDGMIKVREFMPDIVLLDLLMPKESGFDVLDDIKKDDAIKHIPVLVLSNIMADFEELVKKGAAECLLKVNQTPGEIAEKVKTILSQRPQKPL